MEIWNELGLARSLWQAPRRDGNGSGCGGSLHPLLDEAEAKLAASQAERSQLIEAAVVVAHPLVRCN